MALSAKTNQLTGPAVTGNSASTDPGFQPKALITWNGLQTAAGAAADAQFSLGVASSTTTENAAGYNSADTVTTSDTVRYFNTARLGVNFAAGTVTTNLVYDLTSFDATGFTLNWATLGTTNPLFNYLALGGADITNVASGNYAMNTTTGNQAVTGVGFQPDVVILFATLQASSGQSNNNNQYGFGAMDAAGNQWSATQKSQNAVGTSNTNRAFANNACLILTQSAADNIAHSQAFVSMDSDGFTVNITTALGTASLVGYLAIKGGKWKVGTDTQKTSTGTKGTTGLGFQPQGVLFGTTCGTTTTGVDTNARLCVGASTGSSNNVSLWTGDADNSALMVADTIMSNSKCLVMATEAVLVAPTTQAEANIDSLDSDGFTLNWTTADATARVFGYVAFGNSSVTAAVSAETLMMMGV